jgi:predicted permease
MREWRQDLRYGLRLIARRPGTSLLAVVALALGIGLTTTMFSIVQGVILRGLPFESADRLLAVSPASVVDGRRQPATLHDFLDWRDAQTSFEALAAYTERPVTLASDTAWPVRLRGAEVTPDLFRVLGVVPIVGRLFHEADAARGAPRVALIGYRLWHDQFARDPAIGGRTVRLDGAPATIVGVLPDRFGFPEAEQIWMPLDLTRPSSRADGPSLSVLGRLKTDATVESAAADLKAVAGRLAATNPENKNVGARVSPFLADALPQRIRTTFFAMLTAVLGVMLIACVNVTNLQLARAAERAREVAIRTALGSSRWHIVRQALAEGLVLAAAGAAIGVAIAQGGVTYFMRAIVDTEPPFWIDVRLDSTVLWFVTAITVAAALVSSVVPGLRASRVDANATLKDDARGATGVRLGRFGRGLVIAEVAVSSVLLVVSGLMIRSIVATSRVDHPFATRDVLYAEAQFDRRAFPDAPAVSRGLEQLTARLSRVPGSRRVALASGLPGQPSNTTVRVEGETYASPEATPRAGYLAASAGYLEVLDVSIRAGRTFGAADTAQSMPVAIVDEAFVARHLPGRPALGQRIQVGDEKAPWRTIVGIVPSLVRATSDDQVVETVYVPMAQDPRRGLTILVRTGPNPLTLAPAIRSAAAEIHADLPLADVNSLEAELWRRGWPFRLFGGLFLTFGAAALLLAVAGLYGVMAFTVGRRTKEIGVRMALGASRHGVLRMVLWQGLWRVGVGIVLGVWPAWFLGTQMRALLAAVEPADPVVHLTTALTLSATGLLASLAPALRAASVDPLAALRSD